MVADCGNEAENVNYIENNRLKWTQPTRWSTGGFVKQKLCSKFRTSKLELPSLEL